MVRMSEKGVLSTMAASDGWLTYWLALLMVMGRMAVEAPPRMPMTAKGRKARKHRRATTKLAGVYLG